MKKPIKRPSPRAKDYIDYLCTNPKCPKKNMPVSRNCQISYPKCGFCHQHLSFA